MIGNVVDNGPYIVVAPVSLSRTPGRHRPCTAPGMSWIRLTTPVAFGHKTNDPVTLVVALAATDASAHTAAMAELAKLLGDPARRTALDTAGTPAELLAVLDAGRPAPAGAATAKSAQPHPHGVRKWAWAPASF